MSRSREVGRSSSAIRPSTLRPSRRSSGCRVRRSRRRPSAKTHGVRPLIGPDAAEEAIRRDLADSNLVHLAAHGRLDPIAPSDSSIVLAGRDELTVSDFIGLRIDAELAVLSACDSGRGAASLGGDVVGLARGLIAAGARRSVVSLWPVDDAPACATMSLFHEHLAGGIVRRGGAARRTTGDTWDVR